MYWGIDCDQVWNMTVQDVPDLIATLKNAFESWPMKS
ncbi:MAG: hypothetical protein KF805_12055 [Phycisphaeraceae bacterium]|nr:hypothetical protein [Phycisphaeraceae bacterium]